MNSIKLNVIPTPKVKETSKFDKADENCVMYPFMMSVNMQDDIRDAIKIQLKENGTDNLPIAGTVSLFINIFTDNNLLLTGILKNILDALNGLIYTDDRNISSLLIRRLPRKSKYDSINLHAVVTRPITSINDSVVDYENYVYFSVDLETVLESNYLPYLVWNSDGSPNSEYDNTQTLIRMLIANQYQGDVISSPLQISIETTSDSIDGDIDNIALSYIDNLQDILFEDEAQIDRIFLKRNVDATRKPSVEIAWR